MERDFMGLAVKQETPDEIIDAAPVRSLAMQWSFSNKASAPQLLSFQGAQEEKPKTGFESLALTGLVTITTTEAIDYDHKSFLGVLQKNIVPEKQGGVRYTVTSPTNLTVLPAMRTAVHQSFVASSGQNLIGSVSPQPLTGGSMTNPVVGSTDLRYASKIPASAQLTLFYNGSVCVYDNISPEKAQAIMLLAGNGPPMTSSATAPAALVQASMPRSSVLDGFVVSEPYGTTSHRSSPTPVTSISVSPCAGRSGTMNDMTASKPGGVLVSSNKAEPLKVVNSRGSVSATLLSSDTVPQFRRKSLARFLEKRKERVINASPYANKQSPDSSTPGAGSTSLSVNSSGSCPVPAVK